MGVSPQFSPTEATYIQSLIINHISMYLELSVTTFTIHNNTSRTIALTNLDEDILFCYLASTYGGLYDN